MKKFSVRLATVDPVLVALSTLQQGLIHGVYSKKEFIDMAHRIKVLELIIDDMEKDSLKREIIKLNIQNVAIALDQQAAAIAVIASIMKTILKESQGEKP